MLHVSTKGHCALQDRLRSPLPVVYVVLTERIDLPTSSRVISLAMERNIRAVSTG